MLKYGMTALCLAGVWGTALGVYGADARVFHVRPDGNDAGPGSADAPFATLERARDAVRAAKKAGALPGGAEVVLHAGRYALTRSLKLEAEDSGAEGAPIVYKAAPGAVVSLTGARPIPCGAFQPLAGDAIDERLDPAARGQVRCADLNALGFPKTSVPRDNFRLPFGIPELFVNGRRMTLACWPNEGWATIAKIIDQGTMRNDGSVSDSADPKKARPKENRGGVFEYEGDRPARWRVEQGVWLHGFWCFDWYDDAIRVAAIDPAQRRITFKVAHVYGVRQGNPSPRRWRAVNLLEELDRPGEYFIDVAANRLYLWPDQDLTQARVALAVRDEPLIVLQNATDIALRGLIFEEGQGDGLTITECRRVTVEECVFRNLRRKSIHMNGGASNRIARCDIYDTGTGGVTLGGGDRKTLTPAGHVLEDTHIRRFSVHQFTYASALHFSGVGNVARHNLIHDAPHQAISMHGNNHLFEYNVVSNVCMASDDAAAFYKGRNPSCRGNVLRYNLWSEIGSPRGHGNAAVYFDDGDGGETVYGNLFLPLRDPGKGSFARSFFAWRTRQHRDESVSSSACKTRAGFRLRNDAR